MVSQIKTHKIPEDWKIVKLKDICEIIRGTEPGSKTYNKEGKGYRFIRVSDLSKQVLEPVFTTEKKENLVFSNKDDILLALDGVPGVVGRGYEGAISSGIRIIRPKNDNVNKDFIFYALQHGFVQKIIKSYTTGTTIKHAGKSVEFIKIPLPPLHEQQKIVEILSLVDLAIEKSNQLIEKTEKLKKLLMHYLLTKGIGHKEFKDTEIGKIPKDWKVVKLEEVVLKVSDIEHRMPKKVNKGIPFISVKYMMKYQDYEFYININDPDIEFISEEDYKNLSRRFNPEKGDIIYSRFGSIGHAKLIADDKPFIGSYSIVLIKPNKNIIDTAFLVSVLNSKKVRFQTRILTKGSANRNLHLKDIKNLRIPLPSLEEQKKIAEILLTIDKKLKLERKRKEKLEKIKKILLDLLLTGKVRVKI